MPSFFKDLKMEFIDEKEVLLDIEKLTEDKKIDQRKKLDLYKIIQSVSSACDKNIKELKKLLSKHEILGKVEPLQLINETEELFTSSESKKQFKNSVISSLLNACYQQCQGDINELLFFAAATLKLPKLQEIIKLSTQEELNQTRFSDSVIIFVLKYADICSDNFLECIKILVEAGVDINKIDTSGRFAIDYVAILFKKNTDSKIRDDLLKVGKLLLDRGISKFEERYTKDFIELEMIIDLKEYKYAWLDVKERLFFWISTQKITEFKKFRKIRQYVNCDNGENTLLQFAVNKSQNMLPIVEYLLKQGADPNKVTEINPLSPLEIAARNNYQEIFKLILNSKETKITEEQFNNFVKWRGYSVKRELFGIILESDKLDPTFVFTRTGNTPLHYAIRLCHRNAIQKLLKRPDVSLTVRNVAGKCPLDILNATDLNTFLDSCLIFDTRRTIDFNSTEYTMQFRFKRLTDGTVTEVDVISQIGKYRHLEHLLAHPLVHSYIMLKWYKVRLYFWTILALQAFLFLFLSVFFYRLPFSSGTEQAFLFCFSVVNIVLKCWIFLSPSERLKECFTFSIKPTTLHEYSEIILMVTLIGSFFMVEFRAFVFIEMAIVFLLTAGYHPRLSHWSIMLQTVFKTFTMLLLFFSLLMVAFAAGFHLMFHDHRFFVLLQRSIFITYFMTIGEINVSAVDFDNTSIGGYLLFFLFAMSMSVVIINFWTGVAIRDIDKFEKHSEVNALKNVIAFMAFVEKHVYNIKCFRKTLPNPLLFPEGANVNFVVDFYVNKDNQFEQKYVKKCEDSEIQKVVPRKHFPPQLDKICFRKIKFHYYKQQNNTNEQKMLAKLDKILQILETTSQNKKKIIFERQNTVQ